MSKKNVKKVEILNNNKDLKNDHPLDIDLAVEVSDILEKMPWLDYTLYNRNQAEEDNEDNNTDIYNKNIFIELKFWGANSYFDVKKDFWIHTSFTNNLILHHDGKVYDKEFLLKTFSVGYKLNDKKIPKDESETKIEYLGLMSKKNFTKIKNIILDEENFFEKEYNNRVMYDMNYTITINMNDKSKSVVGETDLYNFLRDIIINNLPKNIKPEVIEHSVKEVKPEEINPWHVRI